MKARQLLENLDPDMALEVFGHEKQLGPAKKISGHSLPDLGGGKKLRPQIQPPPPPSQEVSAGPDYPKPEGTTHLLRRPKDRSRPTSVHNLPVRPHRVDPLIGPRESAQEVVKQLLA